MFKIVKRVSKRGNAYTALVYVAEDNFVVYLSFENKAIAELAIRLGVYDSLCNLSVGEEIVI